MGETEPHLTEKNNRSLHTQFTHYNRKKSQGFNFLALQKGKRKNEFVLGIGGECCERRCMT